MEVDGIAVAATATVMVVRAMSCRSRRRRARSSWMAINARCETRRAAGDDAAGQRHGPARGSAWTGRSSRRDAAHTPLPRQPRHCAGPSDREVDDEDHDEDVDDHSDESKKPHYLG